MPGAVALWFFVGALPACVWAGLTDLREMRIPNSAVLLLAGTFAVLGLLLLPVEGWTLSDWAWRWAQLAAVLALGMILNAAGLIGAGDAKLAAAAAPFVALADWRLVLWIALASILACWLLHRMAMVTVGRRLAPDWASWSSGKRFPMGIVIGTALLAYLAISATA